MSREKEGLMITTDKAAMDIRYIHEFLAQRSYWSANIPFDIVRRSIEGSLCFAVFDGKQQMGFARVISDKATFAYLADVFIDEAYRGRGLSKWLVETIMSHPELQGLRVWMLTTSDAHGLYAQFGFRALEEPDKVMRKAIPDIYKR